MARAEDTVDLEAAFAKAAKGERVILRHAGQRFGLVPVEQLEALEDAADVAASREAMAEGPARPWSEVRKKYGLA